MQKSENVGELLKQSGEVDTEVPEAEEIAQKLTQSL